MSFTNYLEVINYNGAAEAAERVMERHSNAMLRSV